MRPQFFWRNWPTALQFFYGLLVLIIIISAVLVLYFDFSGLDHIIGWDTLARTEQLELPIQQFQVNLFEFTTELDTAVFWQYFDGGTIQINQFSYYLFLFFTALSLVTLITVMTDLKGFWYFVGASLLLVALVNYKFELIYLFGRDDKTGLIIAFVLYIPLSYYFNRINPAVNLWKRFLAFAGLTIFFGLIIHQFAEVDRPFFYLATSGILNPMVISLVFILMVAHEIMIGLIYVITSTKQLGSGKNLNHFLIVSAIYLVNLILAYMYEAHIIDWDLIYINLFVLLLISGLTGFWSYKLRETQYSYLFDFNPAGALFYAAMFLCCLTTIAHFYATANDPAIEVFRDIIIYSHLGFGLIFLIYVLANFITPLGQNLPVHRILFSPPRMPYFTFRLAGAITFLAFVFAANIQVPVRQGTAAYYNGLGDMYASGNEWVFALRYYEEAAIYGYNNHKAHYALGRFHVDRKDYGKAINNFEKATLKWPTPQSYVNLSSTYLESERFFDALFTLRKGIDQFPDSYQIRNNLGLLYNRTDILDSAYYFLNQASQISSHQAAGSNVIGLLAKNVIDVEVDSVLAIYGDPEDLITLNNTLVWKNASFQSYDYSFQPPDSALSFLESYLLYNTALNHLYRSDSLDTRWLRQFIMHPSNAAYRDQLETAQAFNLYRNHQVNRAFRLMNWIVNRDPAGDATPFMFIGKWAMQQGAPDVAAEYFTWAVERGVSNSAYLRAIALSETQELEAAQQAWADLLENGPEELQPMATYMLQLYTAGSPELLNEQAKYHFVHFTSSRYDSATLRDQVASIENPDLQARAILDISRRWFEQDQLLTAIQWFDLLAGRQIRDEEVFNRISWYELELLAAQNNIRGLARKINEEGITFGTEYEVERYYYSALIQESSGDTTSARQAYEWLAASNPFNEEATIHAAAFIGQNDRFRQYEILINALEVNPRSVKLLKEYILICGMLQFDTYAAISLETLQGLVSPETYADVYNEYLRLKAQAEEAF